MIAHSYRYHAPADASEAVQVLARAGENATVIAGGTWVVPQLSDGSRRPSDVIDLRRADLKGVATSDGAVEIGACTTYSGLEAEPAAPSLLRTLARGITGGGQIRNQGTVGGSACYANPASDVPAALVALDATLHLAGADAERDVAARAFFRGAYDTDRRPDELLTTIRVPRAAAGSRLGYVKFKLSEGSWPIVTAASVLSADGAIAALVVGGAAGAPATIDVGSLSADDLDALADRVRNTITEPWSDVLAPGEYRRAISGVIAARAVRQALASDEEVPA